MYLRHLQLEIGICRKTGCQVPVESNRPQIGFGGCIELAQALVNGADAPVGLGCSCPQPGIILCLLRQPVVEREHPFQECGGFPGENRHGGRVGKAAASARLRNDHRSRR